jgi:hypothetical protein
MDAFCSIQHTWKHQIQKHSTSTCYFFYHGPKAFLIIDNKIYDVAKTPMDNNLRRASGIKKHVPGWSAEACNFSPISMSKLYIHNYNVTKLNTCKQWKHCWSRWTREVLQSFRKYSIEPYISFFVANWSIYLLTWHSTLTGNVDLSNMDTISTRTRSPPKVSCAYLSLSSTPTVS